MSEPMRWAVEWYSKNRAEGVSRHFMWLYAAPLLFGTRREARVYVNEKYGYIRKRPDLQREPHGWHVPRVVKVAVILRRVVRRSK